MTILTTLLAFIAVFAIVVLVHEFGHFLVARCCGVKILRFSIGFGPAIWSRTARDGTEYRLGSIPLGGYVKMLDGRERPLTPEEIPFAFDHKPASKRIAIVVAGPLSNFLFAIAAYAIVLMVGVYKIVPVIADVLPQSYADRAGIRVGDEILKVDNNITSDIQSVYMALLPRVGEASGKVHFSVKAFSDKTAAIRNYDLPLATSERAQKPNLLEEWGITLGLPHVPAIVGEVLPEQPAAIAGLQSGDEITALNGKPVRDWYALVDHIQQSMGDPVRLTIKRGQETLDLEVTPIVKKVEGNIVGVIGIQLQAVKWPAEFMRLERLGPLSSLSESAQNTWMLSKLTFVLMAKMVTGQVGLDNLSGPISIAQGANASVESGWLAFVSFLVLLSVNLGVINLLPIPMLDGGHLLYYVIEWVRGRPISEKAQRIGLIVGLLFILTLMLVGLHNDISNVW